MFVSQHNIHNVICFDGGKCPSINIGAFAKTNMKRMNAVDNTAEEGATSGSTWHRMVVVVTHD